jgi:hypothetical protein
VSRLYDHTVTAHMVTSAGWLCPVCNQTGDRHLVVGNCFVGNVAREALALVRELETETEDADERVARLRATATNVRLDDAQTIGDLLDDAREALESAYGELERAEQHHRWHHEQDGREVEEDDERLRVLMVVAEALDSLGVSDK